MPTDYPTSGKKYRSPRSKPKKKRKPYTLPTAPQEKFVAPPQQRAPGGGTGYKKGEGPRAPAPTNPRVIERQDRNAARARKRVRKANRRIKREERAEREWLKRQVDYRLNPGRSQAFTDLERAEVETHKRKKPYKRAVLKTRIERLEREASDMPRVGKEYDKVAEASTKAKKQLKALEPDRDTKWFGFNIEREVEGRKGSLLQKAGTAIKKQQATTAQQSGAGVAGQRLGQDITDFATGAIPGAYNLGAGVKEASEGDWGRLEDFAKSVKDDTVLGLMAQGKFTDAWEQAKKHPGFAAAELTGVGAGASRVAGIGARQGGKAAIEAGRARNRRASKAGSPRVAGEPMPGDNLIRRGRKVQKVGSTKRKPKRAPGTSMYVPRTYRKGLLGKGVQVATEKSARKKANKNYDRARELRLAGDEDGAARALEAARRQDPDRMSEREINQHTNVLVAAHEPMRARRVAAVLDEVDSAFRDRKGKRLSKPEIAAAVLASQRAVAHLEPTHRPSYDADGVDTSLERLRREDIVPLLDDVNRTAADQTLSRAKRGQAKRVAKQLGRLVDDPDADYSKIGAAAAEYSAAIRPRQQGVVDREIVSAESAEMSRLVPYAVRHMDAEYDEAKGALWAPSRPRSAMQGGKSRVKLTPAKIKAHARRRGVDPEDIPYVTANPAVAGSKGQFYRPSEEPVRVRSEKRKGTAFARGTLPVDLESARGNAAMVETLTSAFDNYANTVGHVRHRPSPSEVKETGIAANGQYETFQQALEAANSIAQRGMAKGRGDYDWVPVPAALGRSKQAEALVQKGDAEAALDRAVAGLTDDPTGEGPWVLVPRTARKNLHNHLRQVGTSGFEKAWKAGVRQFRGTVLALNVPWAVGNVTEATLRSALVGAGPRHRQFMEDVLARVDQIDPQAADMIRTMIGHGEYGMPVMKATYTTLDEIFVGPKGQALARALETMMHTPGPREIAFAWRSWTELVFGINGRVEHGFRKAMAGRYAAENLAGIGRLRLTRRDSEQWQQAVEDAANGLRGTSSQIAMANWVRRAYGQYEAFGPGARFAVTHFTPFIPWWVNAVKFLTQVLPMDHPATLALLATQVEAQQDLLYDQGNSFFADNPLPPYLMGSIPGDTGFVRASRFTPFGVMSGAEGLGRQLTPSWTPAVMATLGLDWRGLPIGGEERPEDVGQDSRIIGALRALVQSHVPAFSQTTRALGVLGEKKKSLLDQANPLDETNFSRAEDQAYNRVEEIEAKQKVIRDRWIIRRRERGLSWNEAQERWDEYRDSLPDSSRYKRLARQLQKANEEVDRVSGGRYGTPPAEDEGGSGPYGDIDLSSPEAEPGPYDDVDLGPSKSTPGPYDDIELGGSE